LVTVDSPVSKDGDGRDRSLPTSRDVARRAGVSRTLVSYVLNGTHSDHVSAEARARVLAAIDELGYRPSAVARALRSGRSDEITVALNLDPLFVDAMRAMHERARQLGYVVTPYLDGRKAPDKPRELIARLFERRPAGLVTFPDRFPPDALEGARRRWGLACVYIALEPVDDAPTVCLRVFDAGYLAAQHVLDQGHRRLALVVPADHLVPQPHVALRRAGMHKAMERYEGATLTPVPMRPTMEDARRVVADWQRDAAHPTGVYGYSDEYAFCLLAALHEWGARIPEDIALVGTDDTYFCQFSYPTLTSIRFDSIGIGERAIDTLDVLRRGEPLPPELSAAPSPCLIHRGSS
jgi:DNA-binding LacI/PurR family transcriptional regulator